MSDYNSNVVQSNKCYKLNKNLLWLSIVHNKLSNKYSLDITVKFSYAKDGVSKEGYCSAHLNLIAAIAFVDQLAVAY